MIKFISEFKYKKPYAAIVTYENLRNCIVSYIIKSRFIISENQKDLNCSTQYKHAKLIQCLTNKKIQNLPIKFIVPNDIKNPLKGQKYIVLCCTTKSKSKDIPADTAIELIKKFNETNDYDIVFTGKGNNALEYASEFEKSNCKFTNLVNKTDILELAAIIKDSAALISADTGTVHLGYALDAPVIDIFYDANVTSLWAPDCNLYKALVISSNQTAENIYNKTIEILDKYGKQ